jgi:hypothetical protein
LAKRRAASIASPRARTSDARRAGPCISAFFTRQRFATTLVISARPGPSAAALSSAFSASLTPWNSQVSQGTATWERQQTDAGLETFLLVVIHSQGPDLFLPVFINGNWVGEIHTGLEGAPDAGTGSLKLSNLVDEPGEQPFPSDDFTIVAGTTIWIGEGLSGTFVAS